MTIGENIRSLRKEMGLTQQALAEQTGIPIRTIINYENSSREPNAKNMAILEKFFHVSGEYLRGNSSERLQICQWDDSEIMTAVRESFPKPLVGLSDILFNCTDQEQKLTFDILVELAHVLKMENKEQRFFAITLLQNVFAVSTRYVDVCINAIQDMESAIRIEKAKQSALDQYEKALNDASIFLSD